MSDIDSKIEAMHKWAPGNRRCANGCAETPEALTQVLAENVEFWSDLNRVIMAAQAQGLDLSKLTRAPESIG